MRTPPPHASCQARPDNSRRRGEEKSRATFSSPLLRSGTGSFRSRCVGRGRGRGRPRKLFLNDRANRARIPAGHGCPPSTARPLAGDRSLPTRPAGTNMSPNGDIFKAADRKRLSLAGTIRLLDVSLSFVRNPGFKAVELPHADGPLPRPLPSHGCREDRHLCGGGGKIVCARGRFRELGNLDSWARELRSGRASRNQKKERSPRVG